MVVPQRRFGTTYWSHLQGSSSLGLLDPWRWKYYNHSKRRVTIYKTSQLNTTDYFNLLQQLGLDFIQCIQANAEIIIFAFHGSTAPSGSGSPHYRGFAITLRHTTLGRTPLDEWSARPYNTQHSQETHIHGFWGIWTRNPSKREAADPSLRKRCQRNRQQ
jgi:hypothetical protein